MVDFTASNYGIADYIPSDLALPSPPVDAGGGAPGNYGQQILDLFKFGIGAAVAVRAQNNNAGYGRYETVNGQLSKNGEPSSRVVTGSAPGAGMSATTLMMIGGGLLVLVLVLKK